MKYFIFFIFAAVLLTSPANGQKEPDRSFLIEFYSSLSNPQALNWNLQNTLCGQTGIDCAQSRVTRINMNGLGLNGTIPTTIGSLASLTQINMSNNFLRGTIPTEIGLATFVDRIFLDGNRLTGTIPSQIANSPALKRIVLNRNFLTYRVPSEVAQTKIQQLFLDQNFLDCPMPSYDRKGDDYVSSSTRCSTYCPAGTCSNGYHCSISGSTYNSHVCRLPEPCQAMAPFPTSPGATNVVVHACPANYYGFSSAYCYGENIWINSTTQCNSCPTLSYSPAGSDSFDDCKCQEGFSMINGECVDIDECKTNVCSIFSTCENTIGSFSCSCLEGYSGNGIQCEDIDECLESPCFGESTCLNSAGSFSCQCPAGYQYNGTECVDIDECELGIDDCPPTGTCINGDGSYLCICGPGYFMKDGKCILSSRVESVLEFNPLAYWNFDASDPSLDLSGNGRSISLEGNEAVPFYQKNELENKAVYLPRSRMISNNVIPFGESFAFELVLHITQNIETDIISLVNPSLPDPYYSPLRFVITDVRRVQVYKGLRLIGSSSVLLPAKQTIYLIFSVQRTQIVFFLNGDPIGTFPNTFTPGSFQVQVGQRFYGYIDEVSILSSPIFRKDAPLRDDDFQCDLVCPSGLTCVNKVDGAYCQ